MPSTALSERAARAALAAHFPPYQVAAHLVHQCAQEVWRYSVDHDASGRLAAYKPREELANAQLTCQFVIPSDAVWPAALADLGPDCPLGLWVRGHDQLPALTARAVAVTGNRAATAEALTRTQAFATAVAEAGHTVTATLAYGVDATAHRAAQQVGRATLGVLPRGLDRAHPHDHAQLLSSIPTSGGAVVSLFPPGTPASGATLRASAALLAALVRAVVLVETLDHPEAAMHTAETAAGLNRPVLVPPPTSGMRADGNARLLAEQRAVLVPDPAHALAELR
ncbi:DNA protecting protein DprA [Streptomyces sp. TLI_55]|uniref:DNA-processing protein DprA n=1 Tax=Streptomyces sp. TLI_55 TaxID=1938861 RepID=UPI000BD18030|nr:DNA-processing protein DprA [Streptomyces sp. TLI_55]SNX88726.1 DNA protecting protein DprA [Streptomyces sp. TLI_55]